MTVWIARVSFVAALLLAVALGVQSWRLSREQDRAFAAWLAERVARQGKILVDAGWKRAAEADQHELAHLVPNLRAQIAALIDANATLAGASHWTGHGKPVPVPCIVSMAPPAGAPTAAPPGRPPTVTPGEPLTVAVTPHVRIEDAVALDDAGGVYVTRHVEARLSVGDGWASMWEAVDPDPGSTSAVDPRLSAAWRAYLTPKRQPTEVRVGVGFPGPTVRVGTTVPVWRNLGLWGDLAAPVTPGGEFAAGAGVALRF